MASVLRQAQDGGDLVRVAGRCFGLFFWVSAGCRVTESAGVPILITVLDRAGSVDMIENGPRPHPGSLHGGREINFRMIGTSHDLYVTHV